MNNIEKILRDAAKLLSAPKKWGRGVYYNENKDRYCLAGAIHYCDSGDPYDWTHEGIKARDIVEEKVLGGSDVAFNDVHAKSNKDVVAVLEIAADLAAD